MKDKEFVRDKLRISKEQTGQRMDNKWRKSGEYLEEVLLKAGQNEN